MSAIVDVLAPLVTLFPSLIVPLREFGETVMRAVSDGECLEDAETHIIAMADVLAGAALGEVIASHQPIAPIIEVEGRRYRRLRDPSLGTYFGLRGRMNVSRHLYREMGVRNGPTIVPLELLCG